MLPTQHFGLKLKRSVTPGARASGGEGISEGARAGGWRSIWNRRGGSDEAPTLASLVAADGFDDGPGRIAVDAWRRYADLVITWVKLEPGDSIFDVGCGAGAFVYPHFQTGHVVGGIDYSDTLVAMASRAMAGMDFSAREALGLNPVPVYDVVVSNSVFHYFPDIYYAEDVLRKMIRKARKVVGVLELPNADLREEAEKSRAAALPPGEYEKKYSGLRHQYYSKGWIEELGVRYGCRVQILDQQIEDYGNNRFRFNALLHKLD
jgi:SAM-dependent methyltransferase